MVEAVLDVLSWGLFIIGALLVLIGSVGVLRFPDFYSRLHAAGVTDTLGTDFILLAMALQANDFITIMKLFFIFIFVLLTSPVSTHAIAHAAWVNGLNPKVGDDLHYADTDDEAGRESNGASA